MNAYFLFGLLLVALLTLLYLVRAFLFMQPLRVSSMLLRVGMLTAVLLFFLERFSAQLELRDPLFVLVDTSRSMDQVMMREAGWDLASARPVLPKWIHDGIASRFPKYKIHSYGMFQPWENPSGKISRNRSPLASALEEFRNQSGVSSGYTMLLVSDGRDTEYVGAPLETARLLTTTGVKLHTLVIETPQRHDTAFYDIGHPKVAFLGKPSQLEVKLRYTLNKEGKTHLSLMDGQSVLAREEIYLRAGSGTRVVTMKWNPARLGETILSLKLQPVQGETNLFNNLAYLNVTILPHRLRVLHIAGRPSWDVFHLRRVIKEMPDTDLISFFVLRDPFEDTQNIPEKELALIRFPVRELFMRQLFKFDTVVFHNFAIKRFLRNPDFQQSFQKFLAGGKRIIVIAGEQVSGNSDFQELFLSGSGKEGPNLKFRHHPDWNFREGRWLTTQRLQSLPGFQVFKKSLKAGESQLLTRTLYRLGRVDWLLDPDSWRWQHDIGRFPSMSSTTRSIPVNEYTGINYQHTVLWQALLTQPFHQRKRIFRDFSPGRPYHEEEAISGRLFVPTRAKKITAILVEQTRNQTLFQDQLDVHQGEAVLVLPRLDPGSYLLDLSCDCSDMPDVSHPLEVVGDWLELIETAPNLDWLRTLALNTGGRMIMLTSSNE